MESVRLEGPLQRQCGMIKAWKRYHCELKNDILTCSSERKSSKSSIKRDIIDLSEAHSVRRLSSEKHFRIATKNGKTYTFAADTNECQVKWVTALQVAMQIKRRSSHTCQSISDDEAQEAVYCEPWDRELAQLQQIPVFIDQTSPYTSPYSYHQTQQNGQTGEAVSVEHPFSETAPVHESPYSTAGDYAEPHEIRPPRDIKEDITQSSESTYADTVLLRSTMSRSNKSKTDNTSQFSTSSSGSSTYARIKLPACDSMASNDSPRETITNETVIRQFTEQDIEKLLLEFESLDFNTRNDIPVMEDVKYSVNVIELTDYLNDKIEEYQFVSRRENLKGTYINKLKSLIESTTTDESSHLSIPSSSFNMDF